MAAKVVKARTVIRWAFSEAKADTGHCSIFDNFEVQRVLRLVCQLHKARNRMDPLGSPFSVKEPGKWKRWLFYDHRWGIERIGSGNDSRALCLETISCSYKETMT
jgi:hypothetical protein